MTKTVSLNLSDEELELKLRTKITDSLTSINTKTRKTTLAKKLDKFDRKEYKSKKDEQLIKDFVTIKRAIKTISNDIVKYESLKKADTEFSEKQTERLNSYNKELDIIYSNKTEK